MVSDMKWVDLDHKGGKCSKKWSLDQSLYNPWISLPWLWLSVKWPMKQKCQGPQQRKLFRLKGWGLEAYVFACLLFSHFKYPWIYFWGPEQKTPKGIFFLEGTKWKIIFPEESIKLRVLTLSHKDHTSNLLKKNICWYLLKVVRQTFILFWINFYFILVYNWIYMFH